LVYQNSFLAQIKFQVLAQARFELTEAPLESNVMTTEIRILAVGDAMGRPGREAVRRFVPEFKKSGRAHFVIANAENSAHGKGITRDTANQMLASGVDVLTAGNHTWDNKDIFTFVRNEPLLLRPGNYAPVPEVPGRGCAVFQLQDRPDVQIGVMNLLGRVLMGNSVECPFRTADSMVNELSQHTPIMILDFHAEATSEKVAMGWYLDGRASCVYGTHTHVQTADEQVLPGGTAYLTDLGMTGGHRGVIGVKQEEVLKRFLTGLPVRHEVATEDVLFCGALVTVDADTGRALAIERIRERAD
jgi:metallophosphoesterase (TIGR00282 family)